MPLHDTYGLYKLRVFPSEDTEDEYKSNTPLMYTLVVASVFVLTAVVFIIFNLLVEQRQRKGVAIKELPDDMEYLKAKVAALAEHTGLPEEEDDEDDEEMGYDNKEQEALKQSAYEPEMGEDDADEMAA